VFLSGVVNTPIGLVVVIVMTLYYSFTRTLFWELCLFS
jgi:hypothetical protein